MRAFIVMCLVAVACADKLGYNYQPVGHSDAGLSFAPGSGIGGGLGGAGLGSAGLGSAGLGSAGLGSAGLGGGLGGGFGSGSVGPVGGFESAAPSYDAPSYSAPVAEYEKEFFSYTANDEDFNDPAGSSKYANSLKQALRVVFIKGPENNGLENAALALAKQAADQKTAIYVLNKQADIGDLANKLNALNKNNNNKPEVHFVKYRTPEDAANAQHQIQSQYDSLGGSSQSHNGGVAPVLNFASQGPVRHAAAPSSPGAAYLPASIFRRRI